MTLDAEVLILGGGCAGLSLAAAIAERSPRLRVHTLERRPGYTRDRTWCLWNTERHSFEAAVTHRWDRWRVRHAGREGVQRSHQYTYDHIPADRFYELAHAAVLQAEQQISLGVQVHSVRQEEDCCEVETDRGTLRSRWVFDARPPKPEELAAPMVQRFVGWQVRTEQPCFDASTVDLMDFRTSTERGRTAFVYILPFSATQALVEATYLDDPALAPADAEEAIRGELLARGSGAYEVLYKETGALPMGGRFRRGTPGSRVIDIGSRGGRTKASSGYAFLRIQRQSRAFSQAVAAGCALPRRFESNAYSGLDRIFLRALRQFPDRAPTYFLALFEKLPADLVVRFLSESATPLEILRIMLTLPKLDFLQAAMTAGEGLGR